MAVYEAYILGGRWGQKRSIAVVFVFFFLGLDSGLSC